MARMRARKDAIDDLAAEFESRFARPRDNEISLVDEEQAGEPRDVTAREPLGSLLLKRGDVNKEQVHEALVAQTSSGRRLGELLVEAHALSERKLAEALAEQFGFGTIDLMRVRISPSSAQIIPAEVARELCTVAVRRDGDRVEFAVGDPAISDIKEKLIAQVNAPVRVLVAPAIEVVEAIDRLYQDTGAIGAAVKDFEERQGGRKRAIDVVGNQVAVDENAPVVRILNLIFERAVNERASDIHIEPGEARVRVRVRTDGALHEVMSLPVSMGIPLVSRVKVMADMNIVERRRPQDGQLEIHIDERALDVRVSTSATVWGEKCVLRLLDKTRAFYSLPELGMSEISLKHYEELIKSPYGMLICAGPTGSGKTTTLYATLAAIDSEEINVVTIEDPVEYVFPTINQIQVNEQAGIPTRSSSVRSATSKPRVSRCRPHSLVTS
jgi:type IV pilus assembly protein PilB